jgi:hypothetical protein
MALKTWVFTKADQNYYYNPCDSRKAESQSVGMPGVVPCTEEERAMYDKQEKDSRSAQKQRDAAQALAMIVVAVPVWYGHWRLAKREQ